MDNRRAVALAGLLLLGAGWWWMRAANAAPRQDAGAAPDAAGGWELWLEAQAAPLVQWAAPIVGGVGLVADKLVDTAASVTGAAYVPPAAAAPYLAAIHAAEDAAGAPRNLFVRQIQKESYFDPLAVNRSSGAQGIAQFMPATWAEWGQGGDVFDPADAIPAMGRYMRWLYGRHGSWRLALAAYNWGTGNVARKGIGAAPAETRDYVAYIADRLGVA